MSLLTFAIASFLAMSGVLVGIYITSKTPSEYKGLTTFLPWLQKALFVIVLIAFLQVFKLNLLITVIVLVLFAFTVWKRKSLGYFPLLGGLFFLAGQEQEQLFRITLIIFAYGIVSGSIFFLDNKKHKINELMKISMKKYGWFLIVANALNVAWYFLIIQGYL